jgi:molybdenum cofactor cytidylyltransferase
MNFIMLAAGRGQRMGANKSLMLFHGEPWVAFQVRQIEEAGFDNVLIVTNPESAEALEEITGKYRNIQIFVNDIPDKGPFSSLQIAIKENNENSAFVSPMDAPLRASTLKILKDAWAKLDCIDALIPAYEGRKGHPVVLSGELQRALKAMSDDDSKARLDLILRNLPDEKKKVLDLEDPFVVLNLNTPEDLAALSQTT